MTILETLSRQPLAALMLVIAAGFVCGRIQLRGLSLGPAGGTLLVALGLGLAGLSIEELHTAGQPALTLGTFGFALFIYSVGFEAGPGLLGRRAMRASWRFALLAVVVNVLALGIVLAAARLLDLSPAAAAGVLSGALTSAPTYAAALEALAGYEDLAGDLTLLTVVFGITYPVGLAGVVLLTQFLPGWMGDDLAADTDDDETPDDDDRPIGGPELRRVFDVREPDAIGRTVSDLDLGKRTGCVITRLHRGSEFLVPGAGTVLEPADHLMVKGRLEELKAFGELIGPEIYDDELRRRVPSPRAVQVIHPQAVGRTLRELSLVQRFGCVVTEVQRGEVLLDAEPDLRLEGGDVALVSGRRSDVRAAARALGRFERSSRETNIAVYAAGILLGLLLGEVPLGPGGGLQLGSTVGLLITGVLLGRYRRIGRLSAHVPAPARQLVRDLGILLFIAETGMQAAANASWAVVEPIFWSVIALSAVATAVPIAVTVWGARRLMDLRPVHIWGSVGGGMTSSSALVTLRHAADSNAPSISYAAAFAVGSVLATLAGRVIVLFL